MCVRGPPVPPEEQLGVGRGLLARQQRLGRVFLQDVTDLMAPLDHRRLQGVDETLVHLPAVEPVMKPVMKQRPASDCAWSSYFLSHTFGLPFICLQGSLLRSL